MAAPLLVVDVQKGFLNEFTHHIPERVARLIDSGEYDPVMFTRFINTPDSPYQRFLDWHACETEPETNLAKELERYAAEARVFEKRGLTGVTDTMRRHFRKTSVEEIHVVGIDTDMCVLKIALDLFDMGIRPVILTDCCASTAGLQAHLGGLAVISKNVGPTQMRVTSLGEGVMAAPPEGESSITKRQRPNGRRGRIGQGTGGK